MLPTYSASSAKAAFRRGSMSESCGSFRSNLKTSETKAELEIKTNKIQELESRILSLNQTIAKETKKNEALSQELEDLGKLFVFSEEKIHSTCAFMDEAHSDAFLLVQPSRPLTQRV
jgi:hypothetical protein